MILDKLAARKLIQPPRFVLSDCQYLTIMGSQAYGTSGASSDVDLYGFCIPDRELVFPHLAGDVPGFGTQKQRFDQWTQHHIAGPGSLVEYDATVYSIVRYLHLCMENNPNMIDSLFTPQRCVLHATAIGQQVRDRRREFLHKGGFHKYKGYSYAQLSKIKDKVNASNPDRAENIERHGYDTKFAMHVVRLLCQIEQIMVEGDLDLERNREQLKAVRRGEWTLAQLEEWFIAKERSLETLYSASKLPHGPDEPAIKQLLLDCLEAHYGTLETAVARNPSMDRLLDDLRGLVERYAAPSLAGAVTAP